MQLIRSIAAAVLAGALSVAAFAQSYPTKPVLLITPFPGFNDAMARAISEKLVGEIGQSVVVQNLPGGSGAVAAARVKNAPADGYTLLFGSNGMFTINDVFNPSLEYKSSDFTPISLAYSHGMFLLAHPSVPATNLRELLAHAKANPGTLTYGSSGVGTITHMSGEVLAAMSGTKLTHVPYKGTAQALTDLIGGRISLLFFPPQEAVQHVKAGRLKALAYSTPERSRSLPDVPTIAEAGIPGYDMKVWYGFFAHSATPPAVLERLSTSIPKAVRAADLATRDLTPVGNTPAQFQATIQEEKGLLRKIIQDAGIKP
jgi:tripartite-type tricarboxylate transporter receptor subunit TctC